MSEKTLKSDNIRIDKKEFHRSKHPINLDLGKVDEILISDEFKQNDNGCKYFIGCKKTILLNYFILPQMSGYIKYKAKKT